MSFVALKQQIEIEIIKSKIKSLVDQHLREFQEIAEINKIFSTLKSQPILNRNI